MVPHLVLEGTIRVLVLEILLFLLLPIRLGFHVLLLEDLGLGFTHLVGFGFFLKVS